MWNLEFNVELSFKFECEGFIVVRDKRLSRSWLVRLIRARLDLGRLGLVC